MNAFDLKQYIVNNNKIENVLEGIGCFKIKNYTKEYRCGSPLHNNTTSISVNKETLKIKIYGRDNKISGDLFTLTMEVCNIKEFPSAIQKIHKILGLKYKGYEKVNKKENNFDMLRVFKKVVKSKCYCNKEDIPLIENDITNEYTQCPYIEWVREGILPHTQEFFGIGYSAKTNRVVIPHRYWCGDRNDFVGVMGRTLNKHYEMFDIAKYFPLYKYSKSMNLYGLQENYKGIQESGRVVVYEAEKSVLKRHSKIDYTATSIMCHELSDEQAKILIGLDVDIVIAMDSDISLEHIWAMCEKFYGIRTVYYIYDDIGLLGEKESPADKHEKIYQALFKRRVKYTEEIHNKYLKYKEESNNGC